MLLLFAPSAMFHSDAIFLSLIIKNLIKLKISHKLSEVASSVLILQQVHRKILKINKQLLYDHSYLTATCH